jgi:hypothetical protein
VTGTTLRGDTVGRGWRDDLVRFAASLVTAALIGAAAATICLALYWLLGMITGR